MDAYGTVHVLVAFGQRLDCGGIVGAHADTEELADAAGPGGIQRGVEGSAMGSQVEAVQVAMGVDKHGSLERQASSHKRKAKAPLQLVACGSQLLSVTSCGWDGRT
ncbi:hypothetical protein D3C84_965100 [compost metagenome]